ncbi:hypothetical protein ACP70R_021456 [Stipagrostis hirtigluma subsp. patula]
MDVRATVFWFLLLLVLQWNPSSAGDNYRCRLEERHASVIGVHESFLQKIAGQLSPGVRSA